MPVSVNGEAALAAAAEASGLPPSSCDVYKLLLGGGFGRRGATDYVRQAVLLAKEMPGTPIKLIWSREEDMLHGKFHAFRFAANHEWQGAALALAESHHHAALARLMFC